MAYILEALLLKWRGPALGIWGMNYRMAELIASLSLPNKEVNVYVTYIKEAKNCHVFIYQLKQE